jgi:hypothetical protein
MFLNMTNMSSIVTPRSGYIPDYPSALKPNEVHHNAMLMYKSHTSEPTSNQPLDLTPRIIVPFIIHIICHP